MNSELGAPQLKLSMLRFVLRMRSSYCRSIGVGAAAFTRVSQLGVLPTVPDHAYYASAFRLTSMPL